MILDFLGRLYTYIIGYFFTSWRVLAWIELVPVCLFFICVCFIPTSPYWLVEKGRDDEAREALIWLRGSHYVADEELKEIINKKKEKDSNHAKTSIFSVIMSKTFFRPFLRIGTLMLLLQWGGFMVIGSYMVEIFDLSGSSIDPTLAPIIVSSIQLVLSTISAIVLRVAPRKPLFLFASLGISVAEITMATYSYLTQGIDSISAGSNPGVLEGNHFFFYISSSAMGDTYFCSYQFYAWYMRFIDTNITGCPTKLFTLCIF